VLRRARTQVRRGWRRSIALWRRSLKLRVVTTTTASSLLAILLLGNVLVTQVRDGLLDDRRQASLAEASTGLRTAQEAFDSADRSEPGVFDTLVPDLVRQLARGGGSEGTKDVVLLRGPDINSPEAPLGRSSSGADITALDTLRPQVQARSAQLWTYAAVQRDSGRRVPVIVVGAPVQIPGIGAYELYYIFPLDKEQDTLGLVRRALLVGALALVVLLGGIAWLVTRQVVTPVRMAARIAERLSAGRLEERMRVRGEDDLARLAASFNRMATSLQRQIRQLEDLSRVQRRFVSDVSHELRTPLTTVRMAADVLHEARAGFDPAAERSAEILQAQLDRFESLLADLLEISRYDAGAALLEAEPTDIASVARHVVEAMEPLADRRGSVLALVSPPEGAVAVVDPRRIERVLRNLVVNAIEHGEGRPVTVLVAGDDEAVAVAVRDRGVGLAASDVTMVFNRFWRADPARARTTGGTGLGLSIAMEDAHLHGGWLQAWGEPGDGCQFRLTVPRRQGTKLDGSPIPLEPADSARRRRPVVRAGAPYQRVASTEDVGA
jgi:two-component system sensor histidine kinase MtrB